MPFQSKSQMRWMLANKPEMAKQWAKETPSPKSLPEKKSEDKPKRKYTRKADK